MDREETPQLTFTVVVWDGGSPTMTSNTTVNVTVLDTNDNRPVISPRVYFSKLPSDAKQGIGVHPLFGWRAHTRCFSIWVRAEQTGGAVFFDCCLLLPSLGTHKLKLYLIALK